MKYIYVNYKSNMRQSIIKDNDEIQYDYSELPNIKHIESSYKNSKSYDNSCDGHTSCKVISINSYIDNKKNATDEEITQFFFDSIHKNYIKNRI